MATATVPSTVADYITRLSEADPKTALEIALAETERQRAIAAQQQEESRSRAEVELDDRGNFKPKNLAGLWRLGVMYSKSALVPDHYKNKPDDCAIAVQMALRCKVDILTFLQSSYIVHGKPGIEAKLAIAMINGSGQIKGRIRWKFEGEGRTRKCTAVATDALTGDLIEQSVTWAMAEAEGWTKKSGSKWLTIPDLMFQYRSAMWLARTNFPDVLMGMYTTDEIEDVEPEQQPERKPVTSLDDLTARVTATRNTEPVTTRETEPVQAVETPKPETKTDEPVTTEKPSGLAGVKEMMCAVVDSLRDITSIANSIREQRTLTTQDELLLDEMVDSHHERIRNARGSKSNKSQSELGDAHEG